MSLDIVELFGLVSLIALDIYVFWTLWHANRERTKFAAMRVHLLQTVNKIDKHYRAEFVNVKEGLLHEVELCTNEFHATMQHAKDLMHPATIADLGEITALRVLQSLGMQNLKDLGEKKKLIENARLGLQVIGNEAAKGAGLNELLQKVEPLVGTMTEGSEFLDQFKDNPMIQLAIAWKTGKLDGILGDGGRSPGLTPVQTGNVVKELTK